MEKELLIQLKTEPKSAISKIKKNTKDQTKISQYRKEIEKHERTSRDNQVGNIQKDKLVGSGEKQKLIKAVRIPVNFAKKIILTATSFEVGKPITLIPSEKNDAFKIVSEIWRANRMDAMLKDLIVLKKSETQGAIQFYVSDLTEESVLNKILVKLGIKSQKKEIKSKLLDNIKGTMTPYFDAKGKMILFMWEYQTSDENDKTINNVEIWDKLNFHYLNDAGGEMKYVGNPIPHGFDRIPIVYVEQEEPEHFIVKELIDRFEVAISKAGGSNDRVAHPILGTWGKISSLPDKDDDGKVINFPIEHDSEGKEIKGDAKFIEASGGNESHKNEVEMIWKLIFSISFTPDLSFENLKSLGNVSGVALKLMFLDAIIKAMMNEGYNRTAIDRMLNIIMSGMIKTTNTSLASEINALYFDIKFNSILPDDLKSASDIIVQLRSQKLISAETSIRLLDMVQDADAELELIKKEQSLETMSANV
jgi:SPP1 family phage portal protein